MDQQLPLDQYALEADTANMNAYWALHNSESDRIFRSGYPETNSQSVSPTESQMSCLTAGSFSSACDLPYPFSMSQMTFPQFCERIVNDADNYQSTYLLSETGHDIRSETPESNGNGEKIPRRKGRPLATSPQDMSARATKRREQNRVAQRTYRARKDDQISQMEVRLAELVLETQSLSIENKLLLEEVHRLKCEKRCLTDREPDCQEFHFS